MGTQTKNLPDAAQKTSRRRNFQMTLWSCLELSGRLRHALHHRAHRLRCYLHTEPSTALCGLALALPKLHAINLIADEPAAKPNPRLMLGRK